jgi:hypothetical protein
MGNPRTFMEPADGRAYQADGSIVDWAGVLSEDWREPITGALQVIVSDHAAVHKGYGHSAYAAFAGVADGATRNVVLTAPLATVARPHVHLKYYDVWISNAAGTLQLYEDPFSVVGGTVVATPNRNRVGTPLVSQATVVHTATVTLNDGGPPAHNALLLETLRFGGGGTGPQGRAGGDRGLDVEWVLKPAEQYVFILTNNSGVAADIGFWMFWYEEPAAA